MSKQSKAAYAALREASRDTGWPERFAEDLTVHDRARLLGDDAPQAFGWVLREMGTCLLDPRMRAENLAGYLRHLRNEGRRDLFFWWDGTKLHALSYEHWSVILRQENEARQEREPNRSAY